MRLLLPVFITLLSLIACDNKGNFDTLLSSDIVDFIQKEYKGSTICKAEYDENGLYEVEINHNRILKEVYFDTDAHWVYTTWDVRASDLSVAVREAVLEKYPGCRIDDVDAVERIDKSYYKIELDKGELEKTVYITPVED